MMRIGLLGCGNIGHIIAEHATGFTITAVYDAVPERAQEIARIAIAETAPARARWGSERVFLAGNSTRRQLMAESIKLIAMSTTYVVLVGASIM